MGEESLVKLPSDKCLWTLMISQHWFMLSGARQQAITWANVYPDLCRHMASLGHSELSVWFIQAFSCSLYRNLVQMVYSWCYHVIATQPDSISTPIEFVPGCAQSRRFMGRRQTLDQSLCGCHRTIKMVTDWRWEREILNSVRIISNVKQWWV